MQAFAREDVESTRFERRNRGLYDAHMRSVKISAWYLPVVDIAGTTTTALVVGVLVFLTPPAEYLPEGEEPKLFARMIAPPGYNLDELIDVGQQVEEALARDAQR